jgi:hypothetical protein
MKKTKRNLLKRQERRNILLIDIFRYFEENNLGLSDTENETIQRYRIYQAFDKIIYKRQDNFCMNTAVQELRKVLPQMKKLVKQCNDGSTSYGSDNDYSNLCYVSDRWFSEGRLLWLIDLAERNWNYKEVPEEKYPDQMTWEKV